MPQIPGNARTARQSIRAYLLHGAPAGLRLRLTNDGYVWSSLAYSPDGKFLLSERAVGTDMIIQQKLNHGGSEDLILWPAGGGNFINLADKWDLEPNGPRWSPDSRYIYFTAQQGGTAKMVQYAGQPHGISGHWNNVHRMISELKWFDTYLKKLPVNVP